MFFAATPSPSRLLINEVYRLDSRLYVFRNVPCAVLPEGEVSPLGEIMPGDVLGGS